ILGIYHVNVQYIGPGMNDYLPQWLDFLHVQWFEWIPPRRGKSGISLDALQFLPMDDVDVFDFVDPADVLRGCHLIPAFAKGKLHQDRIAISPIAKDSEDWKCYYINRYGASTSLDDVIFYSHPTQRFVDRDMLLRYHWGLGVGHTYSHVWGGPMVNSQSKSDRLHSPLAHSSMQNDSPDRTHATTGGSSMLEEPGDPDAEFSITDQDALEWEGSGGEADTEEDNDELDNDAFVRYEMYGSDSGDGEDED
ncbi:hypothetical protein PAXINDRAFT_86346, partial [Paxillus involutus ATCC 200175]